MSESLNTNKALEKQIELNDELISLNDEELSKQEEEIEKTLDMIINELEGVSSLPPFEQVLERIKNG